MRGRTAADMSADEEAQLVRYMLNDLPEKECERIEELYFQDDAYFEALAALETQLVRDWLAGALTPKQAAQFEARMRGDAALREHVAMVEALAGRTAKEVPTGSAKTPIGVMRYFLSLRDIPAGLALAGSCVLLAAAILLITLSFVRINQLQDRVTTLAALRLPAEPAPRPGAFDPTFSLLAGVSRGAAGPHALFIAADARLVHLQALIPGHPAGILRVALRNPGDGTQTWSAFISAGGQVEVAVPAGLLQPGDYVLSAETGAGEMIETWQFRVVR